MKKCPHCGTEKCSDIWHRYSEKISKLLMHAQQDPLLCDKSRYGTLNLIAHIMAAYVVSGQEKRELLEVFDNTTCVLVPKKVADKVRKTMAEDAAAHIAVSRIPIE